MSVTGCWLLKVTLLAQEDGPLHHLVSGAGCALL